jgi:hypothetical protein
MSCGIHIGIDTRLTLWEDVIFETFKSISKRLSSLTCPPIDQISIVLQLNQPFLQSCLPGHKAFSIVRVIMEKSCEIRRLGL